MERNKQTNDDSLTRYFPLVRDLLRASLPLESFSGKEREQAELVFRFFKKHGLPVAMTPRGGVVALAGSGNLGPIAEPLDSVDRIREIMAEARRRNQKILAYNAHLDVVHPGDPAAWRLPPFGYTEHEGRIFGRGTCDMKGAMAAMAASMVAVERADEPKGSSALILGCFVTEEEGAEGLALEEIITDLGLKPDYVLLGEPSSLDIALGQRGKLEFRVETNGRLAHTSMPEVGRNALYDLSRIALAVEHLEQEEFARLGNDPGRLLERNTLVMTAARTFPFQRNSVPASAEAFVTVRLARGASFDGILRELQALPGWPVCEARPLVYEGPSWTGKTASWVCEHPAWDTSTDHFWTRTLRSACQAVLGKAPAEKIWPFSTDGVTSAGRHQIPTLGFGPGIESVAHTVDEWVSIDHLEKAFQVYALLPSFFS